MGFKINRLLLLLCTLLFVMGCSNTDFDKSEGPNVFYQVCPKQQDILRVRYTIDEGAPLIQLFDKKGGLLEEFTINPMSGFLMTSVKNDSLQITYFVGQTDLEMFLPWFKTNRSNPDRIGRYSIHYNYEIHNTYLENKGSEIDSIYIDKKTQTASLFLNRKLIAMKPTYLFVIKRSKLLAYDPASKTYTPYKFTNGDPIKKFLNKAKAI